MITMRWDETWHRLREWTSGQAPSERLAAQIILNDGFTELDPSHPLGGKDGGKDAICVKDGEQWVMAVYFPRGQLSFAAIKKKFSSDLRVARKVIPKGLAFVTNQELTLAERKKLTTAAAPLQVELYHLERITTILDSPPMASVREQFLSIKKNDPDVDSTAAAGRNELLFRRSDYLTRGEYARMDWHALVAAFRDLLSFVSELPHGKHFADVLKRHIEPPRQSPQVGVFVLGGDKTYAQQQAEYERADAAALEITTKEYRAQLGAAQPAVAKVLEEIVLVQGARGGS
jgi:hypothetical protein